MERPNKSGPCKAIKRLATRSREILHFSGTGSNELEEKSTDFFLRDAIRKI